MEEKRRRIDLRIEDVQASVALLRTRTSVAWVPAASESGFATVANRSDLDVTSELEELRRRIAAQEVELEGLRMERLRTQQLLDAIENETLPRYDEGLVV